MNGNADKIGEIAKTEKDSDLRRRRFATWA